MISFLLNNKCLIALVLLGAVIAGQAAYTKSLRGDIDDLTKEKVMLTVKLEVSNASIVTLQDSINEQNAAINKFKKDAEEREKRNRAELENSKKLAANHKKRADDLLKRPAPVGVSDCKAADDLINEAVENARKK